MKSKKWIIVFVCVFISLICGYYIFNANSEFISKRSAIRIAVEDAKTLHGDVSNREVKATFRNEMWEIRFSHKISKNELPVGGVVYYQIDARSGKIQRSSFTE